MQNVSYEMAQGSGGADMELLKCPACMEEKAGRLEQLAESIGSWLCSDGMKQLIRLSSGKEDEIYGEARLGQILGRLHSFASSHWDFRRMRGGGGERWLVTEDGLAKQREEEIFDAAGRLGMTGAVLQKKEYDFILPLGGARMQNLFRPQMAKKVIDEQGLTGCKVIGLSGFRPINEIELPAISAYAPGAPTELEAMRAGLSKVFYLPEFQTVKEKKEENINLSSVILKYHGLYQGNEVYCVAAPSKDPGRRADSYDTFCYFIEQFAVLPKSRLLLVTSSIYVPYQWMKFMGIAMEYNLEVDCVGLSDDITGGGFSPATNYLQEVKAALDAMDMLCGQYPQMAEYLMEGKQQDIDG